MTKSCVVSFAPGSGGHFVGSVCQYILQGIDIMIEPNGSCHGNVKLWGHPELLIQHSGEAISHEIVWIKKLQVDPDQVIVTHSRNLFSLKDKFDKVVYINFSESDIPAMSAKYENKNWKNTIPESNYIAVKDPSWPCYRDFLQGLAPSYVYDEIRKMLFTSVYQDWVWIVPVLEKAHSIHRIEFSDIFSNKDQWLVDLIAFLDESLDNNQLIHMKNSWEMYKQLQ